VHSGTMLHKRRVPRQSVVVWSGKYVFEHDPEAGWEQCRVIDISVIGVGLELMGPVPDDLVGLAIVAEVYPPSASGAITVRLLGNVVNTGPTRTGGLRVGVEFSGLSETELSILGAMEMTETAW
jgi:PilZ domain-containing protein